MELRTLFDTNAKIIGGSVFFLSFLLFMTESHMITGSLFAALLCGGLAILAYVVVRMLILTFSK